jgi:hypothetical protein
MRSIALPLIAAMTLMMSIAHAAENSTPPAPSVPPPAPATSQPKAEASHETELSPRIDSWYEGSVVSLQSDRGQFVLHGGPMPYATTYARMLREIRDKTANFGDADQRRRIEDDVRNAWQDRLTQAKSEKPGAAGAEMHFQLPARGAVSMLNEGESTTPSHLNWDRGFADRGNPAASGATAPAIQSLGDFRVGDHVIVGYASDSPDRGNPEAYAIIREYQPAPVAQAPVPVASPPPAAPVQTTTTIVYENDAIDSTRDTLSNTGHTIKHGLEKGASKIKHFFTGD